MKSLNDEKTDRETEIFFAVTIVMSNFLIFSATTAIGWFFYRLLTQSNLFEVLMNNFRFV